MKSFDLYFDESGNFEEIAMNEEGIERFEASQKDSQLVGILVESECITMPQPKHLSEHIIKEKSENILSSALQKAGLTLKKEFHAKDLFKYEKEKYSIVLGEFLEQLAIRKIKSVRLCNTANLGFGDKTTTYTSMYAEMVVRIFEKLTREHGDIQINLNIIAASVLTNGHERKPSQKFLATFIDTVEYEKHLVEQIAFAAVRRGVARDHLRWCISNFRFGSAKTERPLQMCDFLSHASYLDFRRCSADQKEQMHVLFGDHNFPFNRAEVLEEIVRHLDEGSFTHAVQTIVENWDRPELDQNIRLKIKEHCTSIVSKLAGMKSNARNIHLGQLADWGSQFLAVRDLNMFDKIFTWLEEQIIKPLCNTANILQCEDVQWFNAQLLIHRLSHYNHRGELTKASAICNRLQEILPLLAGKWEYAPLLTEAMTEQAVHLNDCFEYGEAVRIMGAVEKYYGDLSSLMADALPGVFPERVRSDQRGKALGTQLQSEMFAGLYDPTRLNEARRLNEKAIDEFISVNDRRRQYQYRCQIETFAGNLLDARSWLAKSLEIEAVSHNELAEAISALDVCTQAFALLHWTRIGMEAGRRSLKDELSSFFDAYRQNHLSLSPWVKQQVQEYPAHGIRRHLAIFLAISGGNKECRKMTDKLSALDTTDKMALTLIKLSGLLEVAVRLPDDQADTLRSLTQQLQALADNSAKFPRFHDLVQAMLVGIKQYVASSFKDDQAVLEACKKVGQ